MRDTNSTNDNKSANFYLMETNNPTTILYSQELLLELLSQLALSSHCPLMTNTGSSVYFRFQISQKFWHRTKLGFRILISTDRDRNAYGFVCAVMMVGVALRKC